MSWQAYVDRMGQSKVEMSAICGKNGAMWAASANFNPSPDEIAVLIHAIDTNDDEIFATGVKLSGKAWTVIRIERDSGLLVLKGKGCENCKQSMVVGAANQSIIMGANVDDSVPAGTVRVAVEGMRDYLKSTGY